MRKIVSLKREKIKFCPHTNFIKIALQIRERWAVEMEGNFIIL